MAPGSQKWKGNCALLVRPPIRINRGKDGIPFVLVERLDLKDRRQISHKADSPVWIQKLAAGSAKHHESDKESQCATTGNE